MFRERNENLHCIVVLDGCSAHGDIQERLDQNGMSYIHVLTLPPNVTSRLQPMDQSVISLLKKSYKYKLISDLMKILFNEQNLAVAVASRRGGGRDGVAQGLCPHVYDAIQRVNAEWNSISEDSIKKCWDKAACMPVDNIQNDGEEQDEGNNDNGDHEGEDNNDQNDDDDDDEIDLLRAEQL